MSWPPAAAFKSALAAAVPLAHRAPNTVLSTATDASDTHVGGGLQQSSGGSSAARFLLQEAVGGGATATPPSTFSAVRYFRFQIPYL
jgi:hypothetical protein